MYYDIDSNGVVCITKDNACTESLKKIMIPSVVIA